MTRPESTSKIGGFPDSSVRVRTRRLETAAPRRVGLLGPYASRNLGDAAIQMAVIAELRQRFPGTEIVGVCPDPEDTVRTLGISAFPLSGAGGLTAEAVTTEVHASEHCDASGRGRLAAFTNISAFVRSLDLLVVSGGGQLDDHWGGPWQQPFSLLVWTALARLHGVRVAIFGVGLDLLSTRLSKAFAFTALRLANHRAFRDAGTLAALRATGFCLPSRVCPDLAFGLPLNVIEASDSVPGAGPFAVVSPISEKVWLDTSQAAYDNYLKALTSTCERLLAGGLGVRLVCSQTAMDPPVARRIVERLGSQHGHNCEIREAPTVQSYLGLVRGARVIIASRLHAAILALLAGSPVVAVAYARKVRQLMQDVHLAQYSVDFDAVSASGLVALVERSLAEEASLRGHILKQTEAYRAALGVAYDEMLGEN